MSSSFLVAPFMGLVPIFVIRDLHSDAAGVSLLMTVQGLGAVIAAAASTACMEIFGTRRWIAGAAIALMIFDALFWLMPTVPTAAMVMTLLGAAYLAMMSGGKSVSLSRARRAGTREGATPWGTPLPWPPSLEDRGRQLGRVDSRCAKFSSTPSGVVPGPGPA